MVFAPDAIDAHLAEVDATIRGKQGELATFLREQEEVKERATSSTASTSKRAFGHCLPGTQRLPRGAQTFYEKWEDRKSVV